MTTWITGGLDAVAVTRITDETRSAPIVVRPSSVAEPVLIRDVTIAGQGDYAIDIEYPPVDSWVWPTATLENVTIRGTWRKGLVRLRHCWNARLTNVLAAGRITLETIAAPETPVGFDLGGSMDVHVTNCCVTCTQDGLRTEDAEGLHVVGGYYMHCRRGFHLLGDPTRRGRWGTPVATIRPSHVVYLEHGVLASDYGGITIDGDFYESPHARYGWAVYLVRCEDTRIAVRCWFNQPDRRGGAIVLSGCKTTTIAGTRVSDSMDLGLIELEDCTGTTVGVNAWGGTRSYPALT